MRLTRMRSTFIAATGKMLATVLAAVEAATLAHAAAAIATAAYVSTATAMTNTNNNNSNNNNYYNNHNNNNNFNSLHNNNNNINNGTLYVTLDEHTIASLTAMNMTTSTTTTMKMKMTTTTTTTMTPMDGVTATTITNSNNDMNTNINNNNDDQNIAFITDGEMDPALAYVPPLQRPETYVVAALFTLIFIVGVLGNGTLVIIFFRHRSMRNIPNTYILSLALADLLVIIVCVPMATIVYTQESWTFGVNLCRISEFFKDISIGVSVFTLTALSGERYCAIVNPLRKLQTKPLTVFTAAMIWLLAILLGTPSFIVSDVDEIPMNAHNFTILYCTPFGKNGTNTETYTKYTVICKACIYYFLPLSIIGALYILMAKRLHMSAREMPGEALGMQSRSQARARRHVARMVVAFVVVFFACFFPYHLFELWFHLYPTAMDDFDDFWHTVRIIGFCTSFLHSCVNPVTLYCISGVFRQHFNRYLCCLCVRTQPRLRQHSTATAMMDTSIISIRRSTTATNYNRASLYINNSTLGAGHGGGGGGIGGTASGGNFQRQPSQQHQRNSLCANNNNSGSGSGSIGGTTGTIDGNGGIGGIIGSRSAANAANISPAQSIILSDKR